MPFFLECRTYLHKLIPSTRDNNWILGIWAEADTRHPVSVSLVGDSELAVTQGVPQLDRTVTGARDNLTVVGGKGNGEDIVCVANKSAGGVTAGKLPETDRLVPG